MLHRIGPPSIGSVRSESLYSVRSPRRAWPGSQKTEKCTMISLSHSSSRAIVRGGDTCTKKASFYLSPRSISQCVQLPFKSARFIQNGFYLFEVRVLR